MLESGLEGSIVNVSSQAAQRALKEHTVYCEPSSFTVVFSLLTLQPTAVLIFSACISVCLNKCIFINFFIVYHCIVLGTSKAGLDMLTKMMALELGPHKVN